MKNNTDFASKPYNRCLSCRHRKIRCDGPRTSSMELIRWCEFMRDMKNVNQLTNAYIAEESGVSLKTIERLMALNCDQDIMRETARRIENVIIGSSDQNPCYLAFEEENLPDMQKMNDAMRDLERVLADNEDYREALDNIHDSYRTEMELIRAEAKKKIDFLLSQNEQLSQINEYLRSDNERKGKIIDKYIGI